MRLSSDERDPGYMRRCELLSDGKKIECYLDEERQHEVLTVDDVQGTIVRLKRTAAGNIIVDDGGNYFTETVTGVVRIEVS